MLMAKDDITQRLLSEIKSLNETNTSLKDTIKDYARTTASTMAGTAAAIEAINQTTSSLQIWTELFESIKNIVRDLQKTASVTPSKDEEIKLTEVEKGRYAAIAKVFDSVLRVSAISKLLFKKNKIETQPVSESEKNKADVNNQERKKSFTSAIFKNILKISSIDNQLKAIKNTLIDNELVRREEQKDTERMAAFKPIDKIEKKEDNKDEKNKKPTKEDSWIVKFLSNIPIIGNLFKIVRGLSTMLWAASPIISILSHLLSNEIKPWQGAVDLALRIKTMGGKTFAELGELILEKTKSIIQWPFKFLKEKIPSIFEKIKIPFAETGEKLAATAATGADYLLKVGTKGGILAKILGVTGKGIKALPVIGSLLSLYFAYDRYKKGDYVGMLLELANVVVSAIPGVGTALSLGIAAIQMIRDFSGNEEDNKQFKINAEGGFGNWLVGGMSDIFKSLGEWFGKQFDSMLNFAKNTYSKIKEYFGFTKKTPKLEIPNTSAGIEDFYNKKIQEERNKTKSFAEKNKISEMQQSQGKINDLEKEKQKALQKLLPNNIDKGANSLPEIRKPTTSIETPKSKETAQNTSSPEDTKLMEEQNGKLDKQTKLLEIIAQNAINNKSNNPNISLSNDNINIRQNTSDSRNYFLNSSFAATNLLGGKA